MSGVRTSSLSLASSLRNWVILDYEEANGLTIRPWAPFPSLFPLLSPSSLRCSRGQEMECNDWGRTWPWGSDQRERPLPSLSLSLHSLSHHQSIHPTASSRSIFNGGWERMKWVVMGKEWPYLHLFSHIHSTFVRLECSRVGEGRREGRSDWPGSVRCFQPSLQLSIPCLSVMPLPSFSSFIRWRHERKGRWEKRDIPSSHL